MRAHIHKSKSKIKTHKHMRMYAQMLWANMYDPDMHRHTSTHPHMHAQQFSDLHYDPGPRNKSGCLLSPSMLELVRKFFAAPV